MQIGGKSIEFFVLNMVLEKENFKKTKICKDAFSCLLTYEWAKQILVLKLFK